MEKKIWDIQDDLKALMTLVVQDRLALEEYKAGKIESAIKKFNNIIRIRPNYIRAICHLVKIYFNLGRLDEALATLERGLERNPDNLQLAARLGIIWVMAKRFNEAIDSLEYPCEKDKTNPDHFNHLGLAYMGIGNLEQAKEKFEQALKPDPDLVSALNNLGYLDLALYVREKEENYLDIAIEYFDRALKYKPGLEPSVRGKEIALPYKN